MGIVKTFNGLPLIVKVLLLAIPGINWIVEIILRLCNLLEKPDLTRILVFVITIVGGGVILGWIDAVFEVLSGHLILEA